MFDPKDISAQNHELSQEASQLSQPELKSYAMIASDLRAEISKAAIALKHSKNVAVALSDVEEDQRMPKLMRGCAKKKIEKEDPDRFCGFEARESFRSRKLRCLRQLRVADIEAIATKIRHGSLMNSQIAHIHTV